MLRRSLLLLALCLLGLGSAATSCAVGEPTGAGDSDRAEHFLVERGMELFAAHCALCHGERGDGQGPSAGLLFPPARDFTDGTFRLVSTSNGVPNDADLVRVLRRGMPGSAMPPWPMFTDRDTLALARAVRALSADGLAEKLAREGVADGYTEALARLEPQASLPTPVAPPANRTVLERGGVLFAQNCAVCHGEDGKGQREPRWNPDGSLNWARDFTAGILKGGSSFEELSWRVRCGLPGSAMPGLELSDEDLGALVRWVQFLAPEETGWRLVQTPSVLRASRVLRVPETADGLEWSGTNETRFVLAPLAWSDAAVVEVRAAAVYDEEQIAIRLSWDDATSDGPTGELLADAIAVAFASKRSQALVGMGGDDEPVAIWHWRAAPRTSEQSTLALAPHASLGSGLPEGSVRSIEARSFETLETGPDHSLQARARRTVDDGSSEVGTGWEVVLVHPLGPLTTLGDEGFALAAGRELPFALACWNGAAGDRAGRKSMTIWQRLALE